MTASTLALIAAFASAVPGQERRPDPVQEALAELVMYRRQLIAAQVSLTNQARTLGDKELQRLTKRRIETLKLQIIRLDVRIEQHIASSAMLTEKAQILLSIPGVGPVLCAALLGKFPNLDNWATRNSVPRWRGSSRQ
jgi:transposase